MTLWRKRTGPIDRAVEQLDQQIADVQRQLRQLQAGASTSSGAPLAPPRPHAATAAEAVTKFVKDMLTPPPKNPVAPSYHTRRDLFDVPAEPLKEMETDPIAFTRKTEPDLFTQAETKLGEPTATVTPKNSAPKPEEKLAQYLSVGSIRSYKPLKHVQRQTRHRFYMWMGLSLVALWFIYAVVR